MASRAVSLYASLLTLYPQTMRDEYGEAMAQLFADRYRDERPGGDVFRFARFWGGLFGDLVRIALAERTESVVSNFKRQWWKWAVGLVAVVNSMFLVEVVGRLVFGTSSSGGSADAVLTGSVALSAVLAVVVGLQMLNRRPRLGAALLVYGMLPAIASGVVFFWFPPMYLVSALGIYLSVRALMEGGRLTRARVRAA